jgi:hypothetical protein
VKQITKPKLRKTMNGLIVFANDLAKFFVLSDDKKEAATHIIFELNTRVYACLNYLSEEDKKFIIELMEDYIKGKLQFALKPGETIDRDQDDYDAFLKMKEYILQHLTTEKV